MGKTLVALIGVALLAHAELGVAIEWKERAHAAYVAGHFVEAEAGYRSALEAFGAQRCLARAVAAENLGVALRAQGKTAEARPVMEEATLEIADLAGAESPEALQARTNLAALYWSQGDAARASKLSRTLVDLVDDRVAVTLYGNLAAASIGLGELEQAEIDARHGLELARRVFPAGDVRQAPLLNNLAQVCRFTGRYLEAETLYREAIRIWEEAVGQDHPDLARGLMNLAAFYHERGREAGAEQLYLRAAAILEKADPGLALVARNELADVLRGELRYTEAKKLARTTLAQMEAMLPGGDARLVRALQNWARLEAEVHPKPKSRT
jgi:tetratricopeptide (TPR) repeat protein